MDTSATIDLGLAGSRPGEVESAGSREPRLRWRRRRLLAVAFGIVVVLALSGPPTAPIRSIARMGVLSLPAGGDFQLFPDGVYTLVATGAGVSEIQAYSLAGAAAWRVKLPSTADTVVIAESANTTFVQFGFAATSRTGFVWALDRHTGRKLWQDADATIVDAVGDRVLMTELTGFGVRLSWFDATSGLALWRHALDYSWDLSPVTADGTAIFALSPTGELHEFTLDNVGRERVATLAGDSYGPLEHHTLLPIAGTLVVTEPDPGLARASGYPIAAVTGLPAETASTSDPFTTDLLTIDSPSVGLPASSPPTIDPQWIDDLSPAGRIGGGHGPGAGTGTSTAARLSLSLVSCGVVVCAYLGVDVRGIDPVNGTIRWSSRSAVVAPVGDWLISQPINTSSVTDSTVIDARDGRTLLDLGPWSATSATAASSDLATYTSISVGSRAPLFMAEASEAMAASAATAGGLPGGYAPDVRSADNLTAVLALLQPTEELSSEPRLRIIGVIRVPGFECQVAGDYLACSGPAGGTGLPAGAGGLVQTWSIRGS